MADNKEYQKTEYDPLTITDRASGRKYYGGDQNWYGSNTKAFAGCGSVACANMLRALAHEYPEVFTDEGVSGELRSLAGDIYYKDDFTQLALDIYKSMLVLEVPVIRRIYDAVKRDNKVFKVVPSSFGLSLNGFIKGTLKYCRNKGLLLHVHAMPTAFCSYDKGLEFIREGLDKSGCVVMLTSLNRHPLRLYSGRSGELEGGSDTKKGVRSHFMTITGIVDSDDGKAPLVKLSTWGRVATVPYDELNGSWGKVRAYTSCLYYFTPARSALTVRADMRRSVLVLIKAVFRGLFGWLPHLFLTLMIALLVSGCNLYPSSGNIEDNKQGNEDTVLEIEEAEPVIQLTNPQKDDKAVISDNTDVKPSDSKEENGSMTAESVELIGPEYGDNDKTGFVKEEEFYITEITDDIFNRIYGKSFKEDCILPREDLRYLHVLHKDINGDIHKGEMIVNEHIAEDVLDIFRQLYENDYPIEKIRLVDEYDADDELSMEDNNSSSFNFRFVPRTKKISKHGRGLAIDINPLYNPYITTVDGKPNVDPIGAETYADRDAQFIYKIEKGDLCYNLFIEHGFEWGGEWKNSKDYQHFEIPNAKISEWYPGN